MTRFIATVTIFRVEIELYFETFGSYDRVETLCKLYYAKVAMYLKLDIVGFVKVFYNNIVFFLPCIQILIVNFYYIKRPT